MTVRDVAVVKLLRGVVKDTDKNGNLFGFTSAQYRYEFKKTCAMLGLSESYVPHSLRHGGATHLFLKEGWSVEDIMHHGRWASTKSARRYIQQGRALLYDMSIPTQMASVAANLASNLYSSFCSSRSIYFTSRKYK